jgi:hypothetical protein
MSDETYLLWCLVEGEDTLFHVVVDSPSKTVSELKKLIKEKCKNGELK